jgi:hypothetical protein
MCLKVNIYMVLDERVAFLRHREQPSGQRREEKRDGVQRDRRGLHESVESRNVPFVHAQVCCVDLYTGLRLCVVFICM